MRNDDDKNRDPWTAYRTLWERVSPAFRAIYTTLLSAMEALRERRELSGERRVRFSRLSLIPRSNSLTNSALSSSLNILVFLGLVLTAATSLFTPTPAERYPLEKTLALRTDRELILLAANGKPFAKRGGCVDAAVKTAELPDHFIAALLAMEDRRFYSHLGIDIIGVARAAKVNHEAGRVVQGGSTLTQQLAKMAYLSSVKSFNRKLEEAIIALKLEFSLTKDEILERYVSAAYFGQGCYGLRAAADHYFGKDVAALNVTESAYLVALLRSPTTLAADEGSARARAQLVLQSMVETGDLDQVDFKELQVSAPRQTPQKEIGSYYADWIAQTIKLPEDGKTAPLPVQTSFEPRLQAIAKWAVASIMKTQGKRKRAGEAALVAMRPDGRVLAMVGGRNYKKSTFNRAFQAMRQPGSAFKTFVYLAALRGGADPNMYVYDEPLTIGTYSPRNYGNGYRGPVTVTQAFASSINTVAVRLSETAGRRHVIRAARDLGLTTPLTPTPSLALGASEVTLLELTSAYAAIAANAYPVKPWGISSFGASGKMPDHGIPSGSGKWKLERGNQMRQLLSATVQHGTGRGARVAVPAYGKTGTSQDFRDAWFVGFAGNLVVGVWLGNDDNSSMRRVTGGSLPAMIWRKFVNGARKADRGFSRRQTRVKAFQAKRRSNRHFAAAWHSLNYSEGYGGIYEAASWRDYRRSYEPRPYLVGRAEEWRLMQRHQRLMQRQQRLRKQERRTQRRAWKRHGNGKFCPFQDC